jgi:hypothetical protein
MSHPATSPTHDPHAWLEYEHPEYAAMKEKWAFTRDHYTGEILDPAKILRYLVKKAVGESVIAYNERVALADYTNLLASAIDSISGMLWGSDDKTTRQWSGEGGGFDFGDPKDQRTLIGRLWRDADGKGLPYIALWKGATVDLLLEHWIWVLVDTVAGAGTTERAVLRVLPALSVPNWSIDKNGLSGVIVKESDDSRATLDAQPGKTERRIVYRREGWERWERPENGRWAKGPSGQYKYESPSGGDALPIFCVKLPLARNVGWLLAKKQNAIFNRESSRDNLINLANHPKLVVFGTDETFNRIVGQLADGFNALQAQESGSAHQYIAPSSEPATIATAVIKEKVEGFFMMALREYGDSAAQRTATEVRQDVAQGVGAFLSLVATAMDAAENGAIWRIAQTERPGIAPSQVQAHVERAEDFAVVDPEAALDKLRERVFGKDVPVPLGNEGQVQTALQIAAYLGIDAQEEEVRQAIALQAATSTLKAYQGLPLVAPVRVQMLKLLLTSTQLLAGEGDTKMADGTKVAALKSVLAQALDMAEAEDEAARRAGEVMGMPDLGAAGMPAGAEGGADTQLSGDPDMIAKATSLNGAQIASLLSLVESLVSRAIPEETTRAMIQISFPDIPPELIERLLKSARGHEPPEDPKAAPKAAKAKDEEEDDDPVAA